MIEEIEIKRIAKENGIELSASQVAQWNLQIGRILQEEVQYTEIDYLAAIIKRKNNESKYETMKLYGRYLKSKPNVTIFKEIEFDENI